MPRARQPAASVQSRTAHLRAAVEAATDAERTGLLQAALTDASEHVVAKAAEIAGALELTELEPALIETFTRLLRTPQARDRGCVAKAAVVEALVRVGSAATDVYLAGARHVQPEPVWGGQADTAAGLRGASVMGLVRSAHPRAYDLLAELLADAEVQARVGAAQAAGHGAPHVMTPLLLLKALSGDAEPRVTGECLASLLALAPDDTLGFVTRFLDHAAPEVQEVAALALGESRLDGAFEPLRAWSERADHRNAGRVALLAIGLLPVPAALDHLLGLVAQAPVATARQALDALAAQCQRDAVRERVIAAAHSRRDGALEEALVALLRDGAAT